MCFALIGPLDMMELEKMEENCHVLIMARRTDEGRDKKKVTSLIMIKVVFSMFSKI